MTGVDKDCKKEMTLAKSSSVYFVLEMTLAKTSSLCFVWVWFSLDLIFFPDKISWPQIHDSPASISLVLELQFVYHHACLSSEF